MEQNIENVIEPSNEIKKYLQFRETIKIFIYFCIVSMVAMMMYLLFKNGKNLSEVTTLKVSPFIFTVFIIVNLSLNMISNFIGLWALSNHYKKQHLYFQLVLTISLMSEIVISVFITPYVLILVPRMCVYIYELFFTYKIMPAAFKIKSAYQENESSHYLPSVNPYRTNEDFQKDNLPAFNVYETTQDHQFQNYENVPGNEYDQYESSDEEKDIFNKKYA